MTWLDEFESRAKFPSIHVTDKDIERMSAALRLLAEVVSATIDFVENTTFSLHRASGKSRLGEAIAAALANADVRELLEGNDEVE